MDRHAARIAASEVLTHLGVQPRRYLLVTAHRAENVDNEARLRALLDGLQRLHRIYSFDVICSTHPRTQARLSSLGNPIRTDLTDPVWKVLTEYDVGAFEASVRQDDTSLFRTWEVAGTSHVDQHLRASREALELRDRGTSSEAALAPQCDVPSIGTRVPTTYVLASAFDLLVRWVRQHAAPPSAPGIDIVEYGPPGGPSVIARDDLGLALGGIRLSELAVPTAFNVGFNNGPGACQRWGYSVSFDVGTLDDLYPAHERYVQRVTRLSQDNVRRRYILERDAQQTIHDAVESRVGGSDDGPRDEGD